MTSIPIIAVLLTCHNRINKTLKCLQALYEQQGIEIDYKIEVFLVDDASTDGTSEAVELQFPNVNVISGNGSLYWNRGMHLAWKTAASTKDFDYYVWLNDDTFLFKNAIKMLLNGAYSSKNKAIICGCTISLETNRISYGGFSEDSKRLIPIGELQETYSINGNCVLIPRYVYKAIGILDNRFPHAIGDFEYGLRARKHGFSSFISEDYVGSCEGNEKLPIWCSSSVPLKKRIQNLYSPLGNSHPYYFFIFEMKYHGLITAIKHFLSIHLRVLIPSLWK